MSKPVVQSPSEGNERYEKYTAAGDTFGLARTATCAVLAACWREPIERLAEVVNDGESPALFGPLKPPELHTLRSEYARLFIDSAGPPCSPHENVYRDKADDDESGEVLGLTTTAVECWHQAFGAEHRPEQCDLPDHVVMELESCAYLAEYGRDDRLDQFRDEHLMQWVDDLCDRAETETRSSFYTALIRTTREVVSDWHTTGLEPPNRTHSSGCSRAGSTYSFDLFKSSNYQWLHTPLESIDVGVVSMHARTP